MAVVRIPARDPDGMSAYQSIVDKINAKQSSILEIVMVVSVNTDSKSAAFLKYCSIVPDEPLAHVKLDNAIENLFCTMLRGGAEM